MVRGQTILRLGKKLIDKGIKHAPELHKLGTRKKKNNNFKKTLESDIPNYATKQAQEKLLN